MVLSVLVTADSVMLRNSVSRDLPTVASVLSSAV